MAVDTATVLFSFLGGFFMGSYPVPIKCPSVLRVDPHPVIFQCYKTFWVFVTGWFFVLFNGGKGFQFSWWGIASAACWIPSGLGMIVAAPRVGLAVATVVTAGVNSVFSFLVFWLVFGGAIVEHGSPGHTFVLAPWYLAAVMLGLVALVAVPRVGCGTGVSARETSEESVGQSVAPEEPKALPEQASLVGVPHRGRLAQFTIGLSAAVICGLGSAAQFSVGFEGRSVEESVAGCKDDPDNCPERLLEQFNNFGSWMASFGIGAVVVTAFVVLCVISGERLSGRPMPPVHFRELWMPGSAAGISWTLGNFFQLAAIMRGGPEVIAATNQCFQMVTSGVWGLIYYREVRGAFRMMMWSLSASWTVAAAVLLCGEKATGT